MRKKLVTLFLTTLFLSICSFAQTGNEEVDAFLQRAQTQRTVLSYEYTIQGPTDITVSGNAVIQKECFRMEGAGLLIMCDGSSIWTLDLEGKEAYVEKAGPMDYMKYLRDIELVGDRLEGSYAEPMSGSIIPFVIKNVQFYPVSGDLTPFSPSEDTFSDGDWIITDLR